LSLPGNLGPMNGDTPGNYGPMNVGAGWGDSGGGILRVWR
jgi:hypothetical protein